MSQGIILGRRSKTARAKKCVSIMPSGTILTVIKHPCLVHVDDSSHSISHYREARGPAAGFRFHEQANWLTKCRYEQEFPENVSLMISATPPNE